MVGSDVVAVSKKFFNPCALQQNGWISNRTCKQQTSWTEQGVQASLCQMLMRKKIPMSN
jgi:hypothetical protein